MFAFDNPILLGSINARVLINGIILSKKITHRKEFPPPTLSTQILEMEVLNWVLTKEKKFVSKCCVSFLCCKKNT
jgi:hypothetical protein